jgi:hypothetical protein
MNRDRQFHTEQRDLEARLAGLDELRRRLDRGAVAGVHGKVAAISAVFGLGLGATLVGIAAALLTGG